LTDKKLVEKQIKELRIEYKISDIKTGSDLKVFALEIIVAFDLFNNEQYYKIYWENFRAFTSLSPLRNYN